MVDCGCQFLKKPRQSSLVTMRCFREDLWVQQCKPWQERHFLTQSIQKSELMSYGTTLLKSWTKIGWSLLLASSGLEATRTRMKLASLIATHLLFWELSNSVTVQNLSKSEIHGAKKSMQVHGVTRVTIGRKSTWLRQATPKKMMAFGSSMQRATTRTFSLRQPTLTYKTSIWPTLRYLMSRL